MVTAHAHPTSETTEFSAFPFKHLPWRERLQKCPSFLRDLVELARRTLTPTRIILFGSRARGDHRWNSDYDLAFCGVSVTQEQAWDHLRSWIEHEANTLLHVDCIRFEEASDELRSSILEHGTTIYEQD